MTKRTKKVKARLTFGDLGWGWTLSPRTPEAYDAMVEQMIVAIFKADDEPHWNRENVYPYYRKHAIAALRAIGITRPAARKERSK